jgi:F0F1-type ATP synthase assembly protein I
MPAGDPQPERDTSGRGEGEPEKPAAGKDKGDKDKYHGLASGLQILVGVGLGLLVGQWLDKRYGWSPWGTTVGAMLGVSAGLYLLIKDALRMNKD